MDSPAITVEIQEISTDLANLLNPQEPEQQPVVFEENPVVNPQEPEQQPVVFEENPVVNPQEPEQQPVVFEENPVANPQEPEQQPVVFEENPVVNPQEPEPQVNLEAAEQTQEQPPVAPTPIITPKIVFIVPYRDREQHLQFFSKQMADVLSVYPKDAVRILYIHQCDLRSFNRGAMKNIGFLTVKQEYPNTYRQITLVFNDVDTMPFTRGFLTYETTPGRIKHFYGYHFALGGIVSVNAGDFETLGGFPNLWSWGYEDNLLNYRVLTNPTIRVDRSQFYPIRDKNILHLGDGLERTVNRKEFDAYIQETPEGFHSITQLNTLLEPRPNTGGLNETFVQVLDFQTGRAEDVAAQKEHKLAEGSRPFGDMPTPAIRKPVLHRRGSARMSLVMR